MNKATTLFIAGTLLVSSAIGFAEEAKPDVDGATLGKWTMDLDAAKKLAAEKKVPILLDFSGSDWCGWCKIMEKNVFTQPDWATYAKEHLVMVLLDYPSDKSLVPEKYVKRNAALKDTYGVRGFPTFVILDSDGKTELGRLGAGQEKTPESFIAELKGLLRNSAAEIAKYCATLSPKAKAEFEALTAKIEAQKQQLSAEEAIVSAATKKVGELNVSLEKLKEEMQAFRIAQLSEEQQLAYKKIKTQHDAKTAELEAWIATQPKRNEENTKKYQAMMKDIQELATQLEKF